jgi:hypothetical protein
MAASAHRSIDTAQSKRLDELDRSRVAAQKKREQAKRDKEYAARVTVVRAEAKSVAIHHLGALIRSCCSIPAVPDVFLLCREYAETEAMLKRSQVVTVKAQREATVAKNKVTLRFLRNSPS